MLKRILCLCLIGALFLSGCANSTRDTVEANKGTTTATAITTATTTLSNSVPTTTGTATTTISNNSSATQSTTVITSTTTTSSTTASSTTATTIADETVSFKVTVRENINRTPIKDVTITVYVNDGDTAAGSAVTDRNGVATITLQKGYSYCVKLDHVPQGYEADDEYLFSSHIVNIFIRKKAVLNENDHSGALYDVGRTMANFTLTDTDGNTYQLSQLMNEKKLIILDFWYVSCQPCLGEFPYFESAMKKYGNDVTLLAVNPIDGEKSIQSLRNQLNAKPGTAISFPMLRDICKLAQGFGVTSYPVTVFISSDGTILDIHHGAYTSEAAFMDAIARFVHY